MRIIDCEQYSPEWWQARIGIATASDFDKIITPAKLELSKQARGYMNKLLAEWLRGKPDEGFQSDWMKRGKELEEQAVSAYALLTDADPQPVGFCIHDSGTFGCSPDRLIGESGGFEAKCPSPGVHLGYLMDGGVPTEYLVQIYGSLLVTGRQWWDWMSYHPDMEPALVRIERKDVGKELAAVSKALTDFSRTLEARKAQLIERGYRPVQEAA